MHAFSLPNQKDMNNGLRHHSGAEKERVGNTLVRVPSRLQVSKELGILKLARGGSSKLNLKTFPREEK